MTLRLKIDRVKGQILFSKIFSTIRHSYHDRNWDCATPYLVHQKMVAINIIFSGKGP